MTRESFQGEANSFECFKWNFGYALQETSSDEILNSSSLRKHQKPNWRHLKRWPWLGLDRPTNLAIEEYHVVLPETDFWKRVVWEKTSLSQERAEFTIEKRNLVIIRATEPTQGEREVIWPVTVATLFKCTFWGGWQDISSTRPAFNFSMRSSVAFIVPSVVSRTTHNQVITWTGSQRDFTSLGTNPDLSKSEWTTKLLTLAETKSVPPPKPSSRKIAIGMLWLLHDFCNGFKIDVKIYGAEERPKGSTQNWKYLETPFPKSQAKARNFLWSGKFQCGDNQT